MGALIVCAQISSHATSPELSDKELFPYFFRTASPDDYQVKRADVFRAYRSVQNDDHEQNRTNQRCRKQRALQTEHKFHLTRCFIFIGR